LFFNFTPLQFFLSSKFALHSFNLYLFYWDDFWLFCFVIFILLKFFFYQFDPRYFNCYFFLEIFLKLIFFSDVMLPYSICWKLSSGLRFHELLVWKINLGLENLSRFTFFFLFLSFFFLVSSLGIYLIGDWTLLFFYLLFIGFFTNFDNNSGYLGSFYLSFSVNFKFF
jgi:hypothetical protein